MNLNKIIIIVCLYWGGGGGGGAVIKRDAKFLTKYVKGVPLVNRMETKEVPCLSKMVYSETSIKRTPVS